MPVNEPVDRWRVLAALSFAVVLSMSLWFSASAVVPQLTLRWDLGDSGRSWLTMSVQLGFVTGALLLAVSNLADRIASHRLVLTGAIAGAAANLVIPLLQPDLPVVLICRFATGFGLAAVYPPAMKLIASWFQQQRGLAIGVLVAATTVGSALPHLFSALASWRGGGGLPDWPTVLVASSVAALLGAAVVALAVRPGPHLPAATRFDWRQATRALADPALRRANFGYLGHMWELYAMWAWAPILLLESLRAAGLGDAPARLAGFAVIAVGAIGCVGAGVLADRVGRTLVASGSMLISGGCALIAGFLFGSPLALTLVCLLWGLAVVADSAQFSAAISELADPAYVGTALTMQTAMGFLLTLLTIRLVPALVALTGWGPALAVLAAGPAFGVASMLSLRRLPAAQRMAGGRR